jgi:hypothetical protein
MEILGQFTSNKNYKRGFAGLALLKLVMLIEGGIVCQRRHPTLFSAVTRRPSGRFSSGLLGFFSRFSRF